MELWSERGGDEEETLITDTDGSELTTTSQACRYRDAVLGALGAHSFTAVSV